MTVKELRKVADDCWFQIVAWNEEKDECEILYDQEQTHDYLPAFFEKQKVVTFGIDSENRLWVEIATH